MSSTLIGKVIMDFENEKDKNMRILARNYSVGLGCSSRMSCYYYGSGGGVPFKCEMHPGIAKDPPKEELPPPLSPPPALLSLGLPKPSFQDTKPSRSRLRFWKKSTKSGKAKKLQEDCSSRDDDAKDYVDIFQRLDCSSDSESLASPRISSSSSSSSSFLSFRKSDPSTTREIHGRPLSCFPMHFTRILVSIVRRD